MSDNIFIIYRQTVFCILVLRGEQLHLLTNHVNSGISLRVLNRKPAAFTRVSPGR